MTDSLIQSPSLAAPAESSTDSTQVLIKLTTRHEDLQIPSQPILVPTNLKRYGLSSIVNHLLSTSKPIPFDFLIDSTFLKTSLDEYLTSNGLSSETTLDLEYVRSILPPQFLASYEQDDWVSSVNIGHTNQRILTGSYDGIARVWDLSGRVEVQAVGHTAALRTAKWVPSNGSSTDQEQFITAGLDRIVRLWSYTTDSTLSTSDTAVQATPTIDFIGHKSTIEDLSIDTSTSRLLSASHDHTIHHWSLDPSQSHDAPSTSYTPSTRNISKKRKLKPVASSIRKKPIAVLTAHSAPVSSVIHDSKDSTAGYSASWDHTIVTHDLVTSQTVDTRTTQHPILSLTTLPTLSLLAAGSAARHITLHDPRVDAANVSTSILRGHTNGVVNVVRSSESEYMLASGSHDGTVRLWDVRGTSGGAVFVVKRESGEGGKVLGVDWRGGVGLVSGGEDKRVQINGGENWEDVRMLGT